MILYLINNYTLESGVRELERILDKLIRNIIINKVSSNKINTEFITNVLGNKLYEFKLKENQIGSSNIVGVTPLGGQIITINTIFIPEEEIIITGKIGETLKDNIKVIISYLKSAGYLDNKNFKNKGLHIDFDSKFILDGSSGSLGIATSILSLIKKKKINNNTLFIGKLDLYGNIIEVSQIKEKIISAYNNGIKTIYLPKSNLISTNDIPDFILNELSLIFVSKYEDVYKKLFATSKK